MKKDKNVEEKEEVTLEETIVNDGCTEKDVEIEKLKDELEKLNDSHLRLMADFDNYKKKTLREKSDLLKYGGETVLTNLLPVVDDFERALDNIKEEDSHTKEGILLIHSKFMAFLSQNGVKAIDVENQPFDTDFHEAVTTFPSQDDALKGKIIDCVQKGYTFHDKVIRFAKVVVAE